MSDDVPVIRYGEPSPFELPKGEECLEEISAHIEAHLGPVESVIHEILSDTVHVDIHIVKPTPEFPFVRLVTSGMSDLPMTTPEGVDVPRYIELLITLPGDWKLMKNYENSMEEIWYWPIRLLRTIARLPHKHGTWFGYGHTMAHAEPPEPYASNTRFTGMILLPSVSVPDAFHELEINPEKVIRFFAVVPLYQEEMDLKLRRGSDALLDKFDKFNVSDIVSIDRPNVARKRFGLF
jgi:hypothetical protein